MANAPENTVQLKNATYGAPRITKERLRTPLATAKAITEKESFRYSIAIMKNAAVSIRMSSWMTSDTVDIIIIPCHGRTLLIRREAARSERKIKLTDGDTSRKDYFVEGSILKLISNELYSSGDGFCRIHR